MLTINHNLIAINAIRNLSRIYDELAVSTQRLSSGLRINSAADDAAGMAIRNKMRTDIRVMAQGIRNASDGISMIQTAEGAMSVIDEKLIRMKELAEQAATGTYTTAQRAIINSEYQAMAAEIDRIANATEFNGIKLLNGSLSMGHSGSGLKIHFGLGNSASEDYYYANIADVRATYTTGLRVGNSNLRDTIQTTNLQALSQTSPLDQGAGNNLGQDGFFGIRYTENFDAENPANAAWQLYGYVAIAASRTSINDLVQEINQGSQASGSLTFGQISMAAMADVALTINGQIFTFSSGGDAGTYSGATGTIGLKSAAGNAADLATNFSKYINSYAASIGVYAAVQGSTVHLIASEFGVNGNQIQTASNNGQVIANQERLSGGGEKALSASAYYNEQTATWELRLKMNQGGESYQVQTFGFIDQNQDASAATIMGGQISGVAFTSANAWMASLYLAGNPQDLHNNQDKLNLYGGMAASDQWLQAQNGTGNTNWDGSDLLTQSGAQRALNALDQAIQKKDMARANLGATQNRLESTITLLQIQMETLQAAESRISDLDVALEMSNYMRNSIKAQVATAMLGQANSLPQLILKLITD